MLIKEILITLIVLFNLTEYSSNNNYSLDEDLDKMILGEWINEKDSSFRLEFFDNNTVIEKYESSEDGPYKWNFVNECSGETASEYDFGMLTIEYENYTQCYVVQGLGSVLTLLRLPEGNLMIFDKKTE
jgi:hypothetical protein